MMVHLRPILLILLIFLAGCTVRLTYPLLEWTSYWSLGDYMEISDEQKPLAKAMLADLFEWHRYQELPEYAKQLDQLAQDLQQAITPDDVARHSEDMIAAWDRIVTRITPGAAELLGDFSADQVSEMGKRLEAQADEEREEYLAASDSERRQEHAKGMEKALRRFTGRLNNEQQDRIEEWSYEMLDLTDYYLAQSTLWRALFIQAMASRHQTELFRQQLDILLAVDGGLWPQDYRQAIEQNQQTSYRMISDLLNSLTDKQRARAQQKFKDYADDFRALAQPRT
jgi:hypothetical protein